MSRFFRAFVRVSFTLARALFLLLLLIIPVPVGELFHKLFEGRRRAAAAKVVKKEEQE